MNILPLTRHAPVLREPGARNQARNSAKSHIQLNADFTLDSDIADLGDAFARGPIHEISFDVDADTGLDALAEVYAYRVFRAYRSVDSEKLKWGKLVLRFAHDAYVIVKNWGCGYIYASSSEKAEAILSEIQVVLGEVPRPEEAAFYMLRRDGGDIAVDAVRDIPDALSDEFVRLAYGDDAHAWISAFTQRTSERVGGLTILEGPPGTGKTSLISEMIHRLRKTHLFYVLPVSNDGILTSPDWVSFWQGQNRQHADRIKVVVLEDAERILLGGSGTERDAVAAVLNIADGLIGRMLKLHLICSVNARFETLDPAIQRPGRLMNYRRFTPIGRESAIALAALQGAPFTPHPDADEFTLAEILQPSPAPVRDRRSCIGFARASVAK
jgi:hypothetical protein